MPDTRCIYCGKGKAPSGVADEDCQVLMHVHCALAWRRCREAAAGLARFPHLGEVLPEFRSSAYRQMTVGAYRLIYREDVQRDRVLVMAVVHGSRDLPSVLHGR